MNRIFFVLVLLYSKLVCGQALTAIVTGSVTDGSKATVAGAKIVALQTETNAKFETETNGSGLYNFSALPLGKYRLSAEKQGFKLDVVSGIQLTVGSNVSYDFQLELGSTSSVVEVTAANDSLINTVVSSVGGVVSGEKILNLPIVSRNALGFTTLQAGTVGGNFAGSRIGALNITIDGINVQDNRINSGVSSTSTASVDIVEEFRVITSPADAEYGRGSGQIQARTRSGTNEFRGSVFELHRNTVLNANNWFNNQRGQNAADNPISPRDRLVLNNFGGRIGGPIRKNKTFFHFNYEGFRQATRDAVNTTVLTQTARQGLYRFYPGARNGNTTAAVPTVDLSGAPVRPAGATADLQTVNLLSVDPARNRLDPTGTSSRFIGLTPLPNNFRLGDGLNTAGFTWSRPSLDTQNLYRFKIDHIFTPKHRAEVSWQHEAEDISNGFQAQPYPASPGGSNTSRTDFLSLGFDSTLTPRFLNQFRAGFNRPLVRFNSPWELQGRDVLGKSGNDFFYPSFSSFTNAIVDQDPQGRISPVYQWSDTIGYSTGKHNIRAGGEVRFVSSNGFNSFTVVPRATVGSGVLPATPVNNIAGIGVNNATASAILNDLTGTLASKSQAFNATGGTNPQFVPGEPRQRTWRQRELSWFFKDDWRIRRNLTLNLGVRWDYYGVQYEALGRMAGFTNGSAGIFGLSGTDFSALFRPGVFNGSLSEVQLVGRNSPSPDKNLTQPDYNNFAPAVGISWQLPKMKRETVFRAGYGWGYERNSIRNLDVFAADVPGLRTVNVFRSSSVLNFANVPTLTPTGKPLTPIGLDDRGQTGYAWDSGLRAPYTQNFNASIMHRLPWSTTLEVRYVGSKSARLLRATDVNELNIFENGILSAYQSAQAGGEAPLFDRVFGGLNISGFGVVDGQNGRTGAAAIRFLQPGAFANNNVASIASYLNASTLIGTPGSLLVRGGLPSNFAVANPQFSSALYLGNLSSSTYHSLQTEVRRQVAKGLQIQANWTWSRAIGDEEGGGQNLLNSFRTNRNRRFDKRLLAFHRTHVFRSNWIYDLPVGKGQHFFNSLPGALDRVVGGWSVSSIFNLFTGQPLSFISGIQSFNSFGGDNNADATGPMASGAYRVSIDGNGVQYFSALRAVEDPYRARLTTLQNIRGSSTLFAIADANGNIVLRNPQPGTIGNLSDNTFYGPGSFRLDVRISKRIRISEKRDFQLYVDAENATNSPQWGNPNTSINSATFGRITAAGGTRILAITGRINF